MVLEKSIVIFPQLIPELRLAEPKGQSWSLTEWWEHTVVSSPCIIIKKVNRILLHHFSPSLRTGLSCRVWSSNYMNLALYDLFGLHLDYVFTSLLVKALKQGSSNSLLSLIRVWQTSMTNLCSGLVQGNSGKKKKNSTWSVQGTLSTLGSPFSVELTSVQFQSYLCHWNAQWSPPSVYSARVTRPWLKHLFYFILLPGEYWGRRRLHWALIHIHSMPECQRAGEINENLV